VCETAIQVHGGIGNTWEHIAHAYLRRALLSTQWFGDDDDQLRALEHERLGQGRVG
jgi:alkylation response protein AidB-like acyl-CoA dehydrogenase